MNLVGARPQFIKSAGISRELAKHPNIEEVFVHSGQHYDIEMSQLFFDELNLPKPQFHLGTRDPTGAPTWADKAQCQRWSPPKTISWAVFQGVPAAQMARSPMLSIRTRH